MSRETFLARVRHAVQTGRSYPVRVTDASGPVGYVGAGDDLCASLAAEMEAVGGAVWVVDSLYAAYESLAALLRHYVASTALCWQHPLLDRLRLKDLLTSEHVEPITYHTLAGLEPHEQRRQMLAADIGISSVDCAVAETGSMVLCSRPGQERLASLLPPVHVAVIEQNQIVPDLLDAFSIVGKMAVTRLPSTISLVTGPSKTVDIELEPTTGVHGPGKWHAIVVRKS